MTTTTTTTNKPPENDDTIDFHHPYTPYPVQLEFMQTVYSVLEQGAGQVGILESPTGTGKSLSLICSALTWLRNHKRQKFDAGFEETRKQMEGEPEWMVEIALRRKREELMKRWEEREERLERLRKKERELEEKGRGRKRVRVEGGELGRKRRELDEEEEFLVGDWGDDREGERGGEEGGLSKETREMMAKVGLGGWKRGDDDDGDEGGGEDEIKIYYTSRTHSQLTQFISELRRPEFPPSLPSEMLIKDGKEETKETIKEITLSSRQKLCINPAVARLGSVSAINDRCTELQQSKSKDKCGFMPHAENLKQTHQFRDTTLATVPDIEDMYRIGKQLQVCPYYASRTAIPGAEVITLPYPLLLQKNAREALGIKLEGNVVIIDEAHNIMDAVANVYAADIRLSELRKGRQMLGVYVKRFGKKLKGENRVMVAQIGKVIESLKDWLEGQLQVKGDQGIADPNSLLKSRGADQINLYTLMKYIQESKLAYKVESYVTHTEESQDSASTSPKSSTPVLHTLVSFLTALTNLSTEGRIFYEKLPGVENPDIKLSYLLLSPTHAFSSIASSARAVILAGGTMSPFEDYKAHLFPSLPPEKLTTLSCGHVIPASSLFVHTLSSYKPGAVSGSDLFEFSFQKRSDKSMIKNLGLTLLNICSVAPDGVVVFFPSYSYLDEVIAFWQSNDGSSSQGQSIWDRLASKKPLFRDASSSSSGSTSTDDILTSYSAAIASPPTPHKGAVLFSVIGGRLSEGINFSDALCRLVLIVGLPYPNLHSPEWKERIEYLESTCLARGGNKEEAKVEAREFYENAAMRAVNQSIGRAVRHRGDWSGIVLVDRRYEMERVRGKLPGWIRKGMSKEWRDDRGVAGLMGGWGGFLGRRLEFHGRH
ncbi:helicase C-terminal domain-containing protein [Apiosordaria backusii]|uniref:ATP-dependent DNA helicase CHL1 n=1 Tax=Apiosordaria backusii TaxID=314023 RepID=A0AA40BM31_9PEZI|nr:helicase C-terminal domain-containing protein [Apiosordaria backusii]